MARKATKQLILEEDPYYQMSLIDINKYKVGFWDVSETISELSYLTHSYFRYYGKFPSKIGKLIVEDLDSRKVIDPNNDLVLDNYAGSGTTLVESKLKGYDSYGIDINPFAVLACKVKTRNYDVLTLRKYCEELIDEAQAYTQDIIEDYDTMMCLASVKQDLKQKILNEAEKFKDDNSDALKWFSERTILELAAIKELLLKRELSVEREFFELAFFAIIRRVSTAHDGEVRPHVNPKKRKRDALDAYSKKVSEMIDLMAEWNAVTSDKTKSDATLCNNASAEDVTDFVQKIEKASQKQLGLVVSHPPYLNCFDYIPVFKLKFMWAVGFDDIFYGYDYKGIKEMEIKSYPASSSENVAAYFEHNRKVYKIIFDNLRRGGYCCVVIGDCTVRDKLFEVHKTFITMLEEIGFQTEKVVYRSTSYGIGQYAYRHRADYNEDANRKKDGVIFFKKP